MQLIIVGTASPLFHVPELWILVAQTSDLLLGQALDSAVTLALVSDLVLVLAV